ncbi:MAG TPA: hypothetical protein VN222_05465 [Novosphingobium sp.]|nr:hypothetical protein [Novosphingobium sp.]
MISTLSLPRAAKTASRGLSRLALAAALSLAGMGALGAASPAMAGGGGAKYSDKFIALAGPFQQALEKAKGSKDAGTIDGLKKQLDTVIATASTPDDKLLAGQWQLSVGGLAQDMPMQLHGAQAMLASGKAPAEIQPNLHAAVGEFSFELKDYATSRAELQAAISGGYHKDDVDYLLAEADWADNKLPEGFDALHKAVTYVRQSNGTLREGWFKRGIQVAYQTKQVNEAVSFGADLVGTFPSKGNWSLVIAVVRDLAQYPSQDNLDLMRLMGRTDSFAEERDYLEYIQSADARRNPGEVQAIIAKGVASGMLKNDSTTVVEARQIAAKRIADDKASLPGLERDARAANASVALITAAGDAFLSYGDAAKAAGFYKAAVAKPGADLAVVNTRLGIALVDSGDYAGAQDAFGKVTGPRQLLASLWTAYAKLKAAGH